ncbi:hypothetical protein ALC57_14077, partial [Trachymyrmex cornetzi]
PPSPPSSPPSLQSSSPPPSKQATHTIMLNRPTRRVSHFPHTRSSRRSLVPITSTPTPPATAITQE